MKFLHAADIHLDSPLAGLQARAEPLTEELRACTRRAFQQMVSLAIEEDVAFVVIAGDLYDGDWKDFRTGLFFAEQMRRLGRPCFLVRGNHDAESVITRRLPPMPNVHVFDSRRAETVTLPALGVALHGRSFPDRAVPEDLSAAYPDPVPGLLNIGVLHSSADDASGEHATYAPCDPARLALKGYDYWALGHIHQRRVLHERPWIVFPGNLQGRHARETGPKGCTLVTVEDRRIAAIEHRSTDILRWALVEVDVTGADEAGLSERLGAAIAGACAEAEGRPLLARLVLVGQTPLHATLPDRAEEIEALCANAAIGCGGRLWIEAVKLRTAAPREAEAEALAPLRAAFLAAADDPALAASLGEGIAALRQLLPPEARKAADLPTDALRFAKLVDEAWDAVAGAFAQEGA